MGLRALLLVNRHSRRGQEQAAQATQLLQEAGFELVEESTDHPISATIGKYRDRVDLVIVGGGDGTLNAAAAGLVETQLPLGILPLGTANDLARTLSLPTALPDACQVIQRGQTRRIDLGWVNGHYFFNVANLGLSTVITRQLGGGLKRRWGILAYAMTAFKVVGQARPFRAEIRVDGHKFKVRTLQIAVGNGRYYGGGMPVVHDAAIDDQRLDLYSLECQDWWQVLTLLPALARGEQGNSPLVSALQGQEIEIITPRPRRISTDGEFTTMTPARFRVIPLALTAFVPG
ncbi:lipid kinase [Anthocerotibacter panamensis]|uniref:lipid kinase n=1 Tax=Anthocerotibacter panamensis TaxID=2857077 RepID=UPI001C403EA9|nr:lipid kinase [Anthocerotibacter panamensis]